MFVIKTMYKSGSKLKSFKRMYQKKKLPTFLKFFWSKSCLMISICYLNQCTEYFEF